jgi:hypothetical protein
MRTFEEAAISFDTLVFRMRKEEQISAPRQQFGQDHRATLSTPWLMENKKKTGGKNAITSRS